MFAPGWLVVILLVVLVPVYGIHLVIGSLSVLPRWLTRIWILCFLTTIYYTSTEYHTNHLFPFSLIKKNGFQVIIEIIRLLTGQVDKEFAGRILYDNIVDFCLLILLSSIPSMIVWLTVLFIKLISKERQN